MATSTTAEHSALLDSMTGGMVPNFSAFAGSERLRPDGRPRPQLRGELRQIPNFRNAITVASVLLMPAALVAVVVAVGRWPAVVVAIPVMATLQNRLFILHHEGAHRLLFSNRRVNDLVGVNLLGWLSFGTGTHEYRRGHASHHRDEFGPREPDFLLYSFYPIARESMRRKLLRDVSGISAFRVLRNRLTGIVRRRHFVNSARFYGGQMAVFGLFWAAGQPLMYVLLWVAPYVFVYQLLNRLRAVAEHGGMTRSDDRRAASHSVAQSRLARAVLVPYGVGFHLAHHVDSGVPFRHLAALTEVLETDGYITSELTWPSYRALWRNLISTEK